MQALKISCMKSLNVLRCIAHRRWGADRTSLLRLYIMLVKPKLYYRCDVYSSATQAVLNKLPPVHNEAIMVATGAFRSLLIVNLYAELGVKTLSTYRIIKVLNTYFRIPANPTHSLHDRAVLI